MKYIDSGNGRLPLITLIAILSISLTVNLPGLAISPILDKLDSVFHDVTELKVQLLTVLPNLVTIPFILSAGKICTPRNQIFVLGLGLAVYAATGVLYFFASSMTALIVLSCLLGVGCGLVIPLAASLISQNFAGKVRTRQLGMKSGLSNFSVIFATLFAGWAAAINWHMSFIVYLVPLIPLCLISFMRTGFIASHRKGTAMTATAAGLPAPAEGFHFSGRKSLVLMCAVMGIYFMVTYGAMTISYYLPFAMGHYGLGSGAVGVTTAMFYAGATLAGFFLSRFIHVLGHYTMHTGFILCIAGLFIIGCLHAYWTYVAGILLLGLGYGIVQPLLYDKTSYIAPSNEKSTAYFSYLLTCNYVGISSVPFIVEGARKLLHAHANPDFSFIFSGFVLVAVLIVMFVRRNSFAVAARTDVYRTDNNENKIS